MRQLLFGGTLAVIAVGAQADIAVGFRDGAPKDRFSITNVGSCDSVALTLFLDLSGSPSGLIFDVTSEGSGVEVFQPIEFVAGAEFVSEISDVADGDNLLQLNIAGLPHGQSIEFTTDIDDTAGTREITVSGSEMAGAHVSISFEGPFMPRTINRPFDDAGNALIEVDFCPR